MNKPAPLADQGCRDHALSQNDTIGTCSESGQLKSQHSNDDAVLYGSITALVIIVGIAALLIIWRKKTRS